MAIQIRLAAPRDRDSLVALIQRLTDFELVDWRIAEIIDVANIEHLEESMDAPKFDDTIYVAEDDTAGRVVGFILLQTENEFFSKEKRGYVSNLAVDPEYEGKGIGRLLLEKGEAWAETQGYDKLTLYVFSENSRARRIYEEYGFKEDIIKLIKVLKPKA